MSLTTDTINRTILKVNATHCNGPKCSFYKVVMYVKSCIAFVIHPPLKIAQSRTESTWKINNYGKNINSRRIL